MQKILDKRDNTISSADQFLQDRYYLFARHARSDPTGSHGKIVVCIGMDSLFTPPSLELFSFTATEQRTLRESNQRSAKPPKRCRPTNISW
ncbi:Hypothetical protein NTJ_10691 [Nesidiocoris tenuis]|uniref:Sema domain-containing protein n=1 Tax=Nesidiocoris tenuis TaxID=355587 RepID=A0ABN7B2M3_9HEMI|nr:Hypothetical protein NTJ_10691 [Nesidiocoris tenuis]